MPFRCISLVFTQTSKTGCSHYPHVINEEMEITLRNLKKKILVEPKLARSQSRKALHFYTLATDNWEFKMSFTKYLGVNFKSTKYLGINLTKFVWSI